MALHNLCNRHVLPDSSPPVLPRVGAAGSGATPGMDGADAAEPGAEAPTGCAEVALLADPEAVTCVTFVEGGDVRTHCS
jgi:hypothetical protein